MTKSQASGSNKDKIRFIRWEKSTPLTQEEAEANLHKEGYESFCWYDVPGTEYPSHRHDYDECLWILRGEVRLVIHDHTYELNAGDKIYLPAKTTHSTKIPLTQGATYLVGQKAQRGLKT